MQSKVSNSNLLTLSMGYKKPRDIETSTRPRFSMCFSLYNFTEMTVQRSAKVLVRGLVKFAPALAKLAGTNFTKPHTNT